MVRLHPGIEVELQLALACAGKWTRVRVHGRYRVDNPEAMAEAALAGLGVALLPDHLCQEGLADGRLLRVLPGWTPQTKFGSLISAVSTAERMPLQRNQMLLDPRPQPRFGCVAWKLGNACTRVHQSAKPTIFSSPAMSGVRDT